MLKDIKSLFLSNLNHHLRISFDWFVLRTFTDTLFLISVSKLSLYFLSNVYIVLKMKHKKVCGSFFLPICVSVGCRKYYYLSPRSVISRKKRKCEGVLKDVLYQSKGGVKYMLIHDNDNVYFLCLSLVHFIDISRLIYLFSLLSHWKRRCSRLFTLWGKKRKLKV
jgi:hypothetical protein